MNRAAIRYAKAALNLAKGVNSIKEVNNDMLLIDSTINNSEDLQAFINNPVLNSKDKLHVMDELFGDKTNTITNQIIKLLISNKRLNLLPYVTKQYIFLYEKLQGINIAKVTTAIPLNDKLKAIVLEKAKEVAHKDVVLENIIDQSIIGGFILQIGDIQYDASVSGKLEGLHRNFKKADYKIKI